MQMQMFKYGSKNPWQHIYKFRKRGTLGALIIDPSVFLELFAKLENKFFKNFFYHAVGNN